MGASGVAGEPVGGVDLGAPRGSCGIGVGKTAEFGFAVPAPTTDSWQGAAAGACAGAVTPRVEFSTTGPACPDLVVAKLSACWRDTLTKEREVVVTAQIQNIGTAPSGAFWVCSEAGSASELDFVGGLAPGATATVSTTLNLGVSTGSPSLVTVEADGLSQVRECEGTNNEATFSVGRGNACN